MNDIEYFFVEWGLEFLDSLLNESFMDHFEKIYLLSIHPEKSGINGLKIYSNLKRKLFNEKSL